MAFIDYLSSARTGSTQATQDEATRLQNIATARQYAANAVQQDLERQRLLQPVGVTPRVTGTDVFAAQATPEFKPIGGEVTPTTIQQKRTNPQAVKSGQYDLPLYSAAPLPPAGTKPPQPYAVTPKVFDPNTIPVPPSFHTDWDPEVRRQAYFGSPEGAAALAEAQRTAQAQGYVLEAPAATKPVGVQTPAQRSGYETAVYSTVGLTPPTAAEQISEEQPAGSSVQQADEQLSTTVGLAEDTVDPNLPPEYASRNLRMRMTPSDMEWRNQQYMAERNSVTQAVNQAIQSKQYEYQVGVEARNRQYDTLVAQARNAAIAGNTGYAQTLMNQADAILQQADDADIKIRNDVALLRAEAQLAYSKSDMDLWLHQATIAEQEFMGGNPSRMLSILEAMGNPTEIEDAGAGKYRIRHPAEGGGYVYERDSDGNILEVPNSGVSSYFMRTMSEQYRANEIANQAEAAKLQAERAFELLKISAKAKADIAVEMSKQSLNPDAYTYDTASDGTIVGRPKSGTGDMLFITDVPAEGDKPARKNVTRVPL